MGRWASGSPVRGGAGQVCGREKGMTLAPEPHSFSWIVPTPPGKLERGRAGPPGVWKVGPLGGTRVLLVDFLVRRRCWSGNGG